MNKLLQAAAEYPVLIGIAVFVAISLLLAASLGVLMRRAGGSLKPLVFFFGFLAIIAVPQTVVHLLDAFVHARQIRVAPGQEAIPSPAPAPPSALQPVSWAIVFGPNADPSLITDAKPALDYILSDAFEARISFNAAGESALAARFANAETANDPERCRWHCPFQRRWRRATCMGMLNSRCECGRSSATSA